MARRVNILTAKFIASAPDGLHADGGNLYLQVRDGSKSWIFRYFIKGRTFSKTSGKPMSQDIGLGPLHTVSLADARQKATEYRKLLLEGIDPLEARQQRRMQQALQSAKLITFRKCAEDYIEQNKAAWKNQKHTGQWTSTLATYVYPELGYLPVQAIDTALVLRVLTPIWTAKHETATRVRARIEAILDAAEALGYRTGKNPARWNGNLDAVLPRIEKRKRVKHHSALPFREVAEFLSKVRTQQCVAARALEFAILTAARTNEVLNARRQEF